MPSFGPTRGFTPPRDFEWTGPSSELLNLEGTLNRNNDHDGIEERNLFTVYKSPCTVEVSNDIFLAHEYDEMDLCDNTFYGVDCPDVRDYHDNAQHNDSILFAQTAARDDILQLNVTFDYELHFDPDANIARTLSALEATIVEHLASATGLEKCDQEERYRYKRKLDQVSSHFSEAEGATVQAVSSEPVDEEDLDWPSCAVIVEGAVARSSTCKPFKGLLTVFLLKDGQEPYTYEETSSIRVGVLRLIRSGMFNNVYVSGNVKKVVFVGRRADDGSPFPDNVEWQPDYPSNQGLSGLSKTLIAVLALLLIAVISLIFIRRRTAGKGGEASLAGKDDHGMDFDLQHEQGTLDGSDGDRSPSADVLASGGTGSLAEQDELALARTADYDDMSSLSSGSMTPSVHVKSHRHHHVLSSSRSEETDNYDVVLRCCGDSAGPAPFPNQQRRVRKKEDVNMLDRFGGDIIRCLNTIAEDSDDDPILDDAESVLR